MNSKIKMIFISIGIMGSVSAHAFMYRSNPYIYRSGRGTVIMPNGQNAQSSQQLKGTGSVFNSTVKITTTKEEDPITHTLKDVKVYTAFVRNCNDVTLTTTKEDEKTLKNGDRIELKFDADRSCNVASWRKVY
jgi:hypothetical protein